MGVAKPVQIGERYFPRLGDAKDFFKEMLGRYSLGDSVSESDSVDLMALLSRHRDYLGKVGVGVDGFIILFSEYGNKCFGVVRVDGSVEDFTYLRCIDQLWKD
jgi:hypothetical protein